MFWSPNKIQRREESSILGEADGHRHSIRNPLAPSTHRGSISTTTILTTTTTGCRGLEILENYPLGFMNSVGTDFIHPPTIFPISWRVSWILRYCFPSIVRVSLAKRINTFNKSILSLMIYSDAKRASPLLCPASINASKRASVVFSHLCQSV